MAGVTLGQLLDLYNKTGPTVLTGPREVMNEAQERSYILNWLLGTNAELDIRGSPRLVDWCLFDAGNTAAFYLPGSTRNFSNPQFEAQVESSWRFLEDYMQFLDVEVDLNSNMSATAMFDQFKDVLRFKEVALATRINRKMEDSLLSQPDATKQEVLASSTVGSPIPEPYSLFTFYNEFGGPTTVTGGIGNGDGLPAGFTTIENQNPTTQTGWRCNQIPYGNDAITTSTPNASAASLLSAMSIAIKACGFDEMPYKPGDSSPSSPLNSDYCFFGSIEGVSYFEKLQRSSHDHFRMIPTDVDFRGGMNIPYFSGIPVKYIARWSAAAVFPTTGTTAPAVGAGAVELSADIAGPRFILMGRKYNKLIFHTKGKFFMRPEITPSASPDATIRLMKIWYQNWCRSRKRGAMIYPSGTTDIVLNG